MSQDRENKAKDPSTERIAAAEELEQTRVVAPDASVGYDDPPGDRLFEQYTIYSKIGSGGMGVVYLARDRRLGRFVAIKRLNHKAQSIKSLRQRFLHEARAVAALSHVHVIHIYALGEDEDGPFIVMEYIAGPDGEPADNGVVAGGLVQPNKPLTLEEFIRDRGQLSVDDAIELMLKLSRAVAYAHSSGVIHRDLKPSNILIDKSMEPKIVDFGLARLMGGEDPKITVPGEKLLSIGYGAPEQEHDASLSDERADVYGLGALLYFTITGQNPRYFREQDLPVGLREVAVKATATDRENRWSSAQEFADELQKIASRTRVETPTVRTTWRCKWCDAVNPMSIKYCVECGWDGSVKCPECSLDTFFGVQFCNNCGADARSYESVISLLKRIRVLAETSRFEGVLSAAGRTHGFEPAGPSGRQLLKEISDLRSQANKAIQKRQQLKEQIPIEMRASNYERARRFIEQYREISEDKRAFEGEYARIPELILERDMTRARKAIHSREWDMASRICDELEDSVGADSTPVLKLRRTIVLHYRLADIRFGVLVVAAVTALYVLSLPLVVRFKRGSFGALPRAFYAAGVWSYDKSVLAGPLRRYASFWIGERSVASYFAAEPHETDVGVEAEKPNELLQKQSEYQRKVAELYDRQRDFFQVWPVEYKRELESLLDKSQRAGDYHSWRIVQLELTRFEGQGGVTDAKISEPAGLSLLVDKYRKALDDQKLLHSRNLVKETRLYVNALRELQTRFMQEGAIAFASAINSEITTVSEAARFVDAQKIVDGSDATRLTSAEISSDVLRPSTGGVSVGEVTAMRESFVESLEKASLLHAEKISAWPEQYLGRLVQLRDEYQRAGDYEGWEELSKEIDRFEVDLEIAPEQLKLYLPRLMQVQNDFRLKKDKYKNDYADSVVKIADVYLNKLQDVVKRLTVEGQMEKAAEVNTEIRRVRALPEYVEAKKTLIMQGPPVPSEAVNLNDEPGAAAGADAAPAAPPADAPH